MSAAILTLILLGAGGQTIEFLGFSRNEALAAYRVGVREARGDATDTYGLVCVVNLADGQLVAVFRDGALARLDARGKRLAVKTALLLADNPLYADAEPESEWHRVRARAGLRSKKLPMNESIVRLQPDNDTSLTAEAKKDAIEVKGDAAAIGFTTIIRSADGDHTKGGSYRVEGASAARVTAYHSPRGYGVAVLAEFTLADGGTLAQITAQRLEDSPVGAHQIGTFNVALENLRMGEAYFKSTHPESKGDFDKFVGTLWNSP